MKDVSMKEFADLCRTDPTLFHQMLAMPQTVSLDRVVELAANNGYRIISGQGFPLNGMESLYPEDLSRVTGGAGDIAHLERQTAWKDWFIAWTGSFDGL
ncbi:MAG: hypothetical protein IKE62_01805 [Oscillospiraceae bacterium]|nr:hypothetical protein [Oscillospiraceae bacterium]